uniref:hypothetical protein n=1 Tax=Shigella sp. FC1967 TaxID=1898041 RepID=UPI002570F7C6|nr:hypothetical protein [Shigella sp. FC1967]
MPSSYDTSKKAEKKVTQHLLIRYYTFYRHNGASRSAAIISELFMGIMWFFLRMESPFWRKIAKKQRALYPHIDPRCPKIFDPLRYLLQSIWLVCHYVGHLLIKKPIQFIFYIRKSYKKLVVHVSPIAVGIIEHKKKTTPFWQYILYSIIAIFAIFFYFTQYHSAV